MPIVSPRRVLTIAGLVLALAWSGFLASRHVAGRATGLDRIESPLLDLRFLVLGPRPPPDEVVIVAIDDETVRAERHYPLSRARLADLVRALARLDPKAIALDILFLDRSDREIDKTLAEALRQTPSVIAAAAIFPPGDSAFPAGDGAAAAPVAERMLWPIERLRAASAVGTVNLSTDRAGSPRHLPLLVRDGDSVVPALPLRAAMTAAKTAPEFAGERMRIGAAEVPLDLGLTMALRFYGPRGTIRTVSAGKVLRGDAPEADLRGRILVIGGTATGAADGFGTPFDPILPGIEVLATATANIVAGDALMRTRTIRAIDAALTMLLAAAAILFLAMRGIGLGLLLLAITAAAWAALAIIGFSAGIWLSMALPLAGIVPPALLFVGARLALDRRSERRLEASQRTLQSLQPPALADQLAAAPDFLAEPVRQEAAVVFVDLSGFTGVSEELGPARTRDLLKSFHSTIDRKVAAHGGLVLSYMGDGAMIVFGLPEPAPDDASRALAAATGLSQAVTAWLAALPRELRGHLGVRVGAHCGEVVASRLGGDTHQHITATGDSVNVASRLLEVADAHGATVAVSAGLFDRARIRAPLPAGEFGAAHEIAIRGRAHPLSVRTWSPPAPTGHTAEAA